MTTPMLWTQTTPETKTAAKKPEDRSTEFVADAGGTDTTSAPLILVSAYVAMWLLLLGFVWLAWRRQRTLSVRVDELERALGQGSARKPL